MSVVKEDEEDADNAVWISEFTAESEFNHLGSPIDLNIATMTVKKLKPLVWCNYHVPPKKLKLTNTGKTVLLSAKWQRENPFLMNGPFPSRYIFSQIHFHWGPNDMDGSDHTVDGGSLPMELHAVHFKSDYLTQEAAMRKPDGISVVVYFLKLQSLENPKMNEIVKTLGLIQQADTSTRIVPWAITNLLRPFDNDYFLYRGSLLSGKYVHKVSWLISRQPIPISFKQVGEFRNLKDKNLEELGRKTRISGETGNPSVVYHVNPSGSMYASLLLIPRDEPSLNFMDKNDCCKGIVVDEEIDNSGEAKSQV